MDLKYFASFAVIFAAVLWAVDGVLIRPGLHALDVMFVVFLEHALALLPFFFVAFPRFSELRLLSFRHWVAVFFIGLLGGVLGTFAITKAIFLVFSQGASISVVLLLQKLQPVFAIILAFFLLGERPTKRFFLWASLALVGSFVLTFGFSLPSLGDPHVVVALFALVAAFSWGASTSFGKFALGKVSFTTGAFLRYAFTVLIAGVVLLATGGFSSFSAVSSNQWLLFVLIVLTTGAASILIYYWGLQRIKASKATIFELSFPVAALLLEYFVNGQTISWKQGLGALVLVAAMLFLLREKEAFRHVIGTVASGKKQGAKYVLLYTDAIRARLGFIPFEGTLNLKFSESVNPRVLKTIPSFKKDGKEYGAVDYIDATINGLRCAILLPKKSTHKDTIELIAKENLREGLGLTDGAEVVVEY